MQQAVASAFLLLSVLSCIPSSAQIAEHFSDGDFTNNPNWGGDNNSWIINSSKQLQSNNSVAGSTYYLSTINTQVTSTQWEMYVHLAFNTSSANYTDVYLTASSGNLSGNSTTGYFVRIGSTDDDVSLYRKNTSGAIIKIIDGKDGVLNKSDNVLKIRVTCTATSNWDLLT
ncbi:MAG TPA: hypothetical protein VF540_06610, partial [Segetibacter sp.]